MAIKTIIMYTCDACGKESEERYVAILGHGDWNNPDDISNEIRRDLCSECYTQLIDLIDARKIETVKTPKIVVPSIRSLSSETVAAFTEDYENGISDKTLMCRYHLTFSQVRTMSRKVKKQGHIRGINKTLGNPENANVKLKPVVVDKEGMVLQFG